MSWTTPRELKAQLLRLWERGDLLRSLINAGVQFPLSLKVKGPSSSELTGQFEAVRTWLAQLSVLAPTRIDWREFRHPVMGMQRLPQAVYVDSLDIAASWLGKRDEVVRFKAVLAETDTRQPVLRSWLAKKPLQALDLADAWSKLLDIVQWMIQHPRPRIYLRQVDIPAIHSKFIETHRAVLTELFDLVLPPDAIDADRKGVGQFAARYGFLDKPLSVRFRVLDESLTLLAGACYPDISLDAENFAKLALSVRNVFITENETNFLAFPPTPGTIVIFGAGYGWDALAQAKWLSDITIYYWGDIDTHGFAILNQLRHKFDHVESFLMDKHTLMAYQSLWGEEENQAKHDLLHLTQTESELYDELRDNTLRKGVRLEQERIGYQLVTNAIAEVIGRDK